MAKFNIKEWQDRFNKKSMNEAKYGPDNPEFESYHEEMVNNVIELGKFENMENAMKGDDPDLYAKCKGAFAKIWKGVGDISNAERKYKR